LYFDKEEGKDTNRAVVQFETESAAKTALLLTNALIVDRPIAVVPYPPKDIPIINEHGTPVPVEKITNRDFGGSKDEERTKTSVLASLLASGYVLAQDALTKAKQIDDEHNISLQLKVGVETLKVKAHELDQAYHITEKATAMKQTATVKAKKIDEDYKTTEKATQAANTVKTNAIQAAAKAQENQTIKSGVDSMKSGWAAVTQSVSGIYTEYKEQTAKAIEEKQREKAAQANKQSDHQFEQAPSTDLDDKEDASLPPQTVPTDNK